MYITLSTLYLYITSYKIPTQHTYTLKTLDTHTHNKLTKNQNPNAKTKPTHAPTHPQTNIPSIQVNSYQHTKSKTKPITLPNKHIKKHQINTNHPTIYLKRARPNGLASRKHHNIASTQNQMIHSLEKAHTTGQKNINNNTKTKKVLTNTQTHHKHKHKKQKTQISHQHQVIKIRKIHAFTHTNSLIIHYIKPTPPPKKDIKIYLLHFNIPYLTKHSPKSTHTHDHTPNIHSTLFIRNNTPSKNKNKQTQIPTTTTHITKLQPTTKSYINPYKMTTQHNTMVASFFTHTYNKLTNPSSTQDQNTKIKSIHTPTHPQTIPPPLKINTYPHLDSKIKNITLPNSHAMKHQINTNHTLNHLKKYRITRLMYDINKTNNLTIQYKGSTPPQKKHTKKYPLNTNLPNFIKQNQTSNLIKHPNITKQPLGKTHTPGHTPHKQNNNKATKKPQFKT